MPATTIVKISGDNQYGGIGNELNLPLRVRVTDGTNGVASVTVTFAIASKPTDTAFESLSITSATTDANGYAETLLTVGKLKGVYTVTATSAGLSGSPITFTENAIAVISLEDFKQYHGLALNVVDANDQTIAHVVGMITELIEDELQQPVCNRPFEEILDGIGMTKLFLFKGRIVDLLPDPTTGDKLDSIQVRASALGAWERIVEDIGLVYFNPVSTWCVELLDYRIFPIGWKNIRVYYNAGFSSIPGLIKKMALEMCEVMYKESAYPGGTGRLAVSTVNGNIGGVSMNTVYNELRDGRWKDIILKYGKLT